MSRINDLIQELCPDGVRYVALGDCTEYSSTRISASELDETSFVGVDNLLPNKAGRTDAKHLPNSQRLTRFTTDDLLIGNIRPYLKKIWLADRTGGCSGDVLAIHIKENFTKQLQPQFLYYLLSSDYFFLFDQQHAKGGKMPRGSKQQVMKYRVPIPPLEVQEEIVRILDSFTSLEAELEAELELRTNQFFYYMHRLLTKKTNNTKWLPISTICTAINAGGDKPKRINRDLSKPSNEYPFPVYSNGTGNNALYGFSDSFTVQKEAVTISARGTIGYHTVRNPFFTPIIRLITLIPDNKVISAKYLNYALYLLRIGHSGGSIPQLTVPSIKKLVIPVPSLQKQSEMVNILDRFSSLTSNLSSGLPAEIEARHKQYEYYRDRLLTFKELGHE